VLECREDSFSWGHHLVPSDTLFNVWDIIFAQLQRIPAVLSHQPDDAVVILG
jgi:hypothetical protein